jgi:hypothetical protein
LFKGIEGLDKTLISTGNGLAFVVEDRKDEGGEEEESKEEVKKRERETEGRDHGDPKTISETKAKGEEGKEKGAGGVRIEEEGGEVLRDLEKLLASQMVKYLSRGIFSATNITGIDTLVRFFKE